MSNLTFRSPWKTRYFVDTEFTDFFHCELISVAIVGEDGREFYAERSDFALSACSDFVRANVVPQLGQVPGRSMPAAQMRNELRAWLSSVPVFPKPILCFDYPGDFDLLYALLDGSLTIGWTWENIGNRLDVPRMEAYFRTHGGQHHALHDARAFAQSFE
ncbi:hypothetical protein [Caballeronia sp. RCC_10]|jgi:hypothetical protein|uniref:hypothetical protein n=1 Tax=Caballeronia sp. RCC_10 TaxID=3239227 RepID=UPI003525A02F